MQQRSLPRFINTTASSLGIADVAQHLHAALYRFEPRAVSISALHAAAAFHRLLRSAAMGKANKQKAKKLAKKRAKTLLKSRDEDAMVIDEETPSAPLTGRQKHAQKVAAKRALRAAKQDIQQQRWAIPKRSVDRKAERKQLVEQAKALRREGTADATDAPAPPDDAPMSEKPTFAYAVDAKKARKAAKRRAKERAREARYDGDVQKTP